MTTLAVSRQRPAGDVRRPLARRLPGLLIVLWLGGCAGRPEGVLSPVALVAPGTSRVDMLVATTRAPSPQPGVMFTGERGPGLAFADIAVSIPPDGGRAIGEVQWPSALPGDPAHDFVTLKADPITLSEAIARAHKNLAQIPKRRVLVFVHGFNNKFEDAVFRFAQIMHDSGAPALPVLFTWPSRGSVLAYGYDRESTNFSRDALEQTLQAIVHDPAVGEISILAHSMGNWLTLEALRQMAIRDGRVAAKIRNVMLAAPDVDVDVFRRQIADIGPVHPAITLFVSQDDRALALSSRVWGGKIRLGAIDPELEPYRSLLAADRITVVDLTRLKAGDGLNHGKFAESGGVVALIGQRLVEGQTITDQRVGVADRIVEVTGNAAASVGSAAGIVLSAPAVVVDADGRSRYGEQFKSFGNALADTAQAGTQILAPGVGVTGK